MTQPGRQGDFPAQPRSRATLRKVITREIDADHEDLLRRYAGFLEEMKDLAANTPDGTVFAACEDAVIEKAREHQRLALQQAVRARIVAVEKKGRR